MLNYEEKGLIPAVIQDDETNAVLMLGYMNADTLAKTKEIGQVVFWSSQQGRGLAQGRYERRLSRGPPRSTLTARRTRYWCG